MFDLSSVQGGPGQGRGAPRDGARVRELRKPLGLSQEGLAHEAGLDRTYIGGVERGERNISHDNIWRLADALGVRPGDLFSS